MPHKPRVIIVGGGLAGLAAAIRIVEAGLDVDLFSIVPVKRSHSVCAQGGINAANDVARQQGYSEWMHFDETIYGGDFLNHQPPVYEMAMWAPRIINLLDRMGVPFNRTSEGYHDLRRFGGSLYWRTAFAGATTGQQLLYALDEQVRRAEVDGKVRKYEFWEFLWPVIEDGQCCGIVAQDMRSMEIRAFAADAVIIASGGCGLIFGKSTNSVVCNGAAAARCYRAGAWMGNPEFIQVHPTAIPGEDKCRLMSESARGEGGRVWVPRKKGDARKPQDIPQDERWYFLEEKYPDYGNLVPRDIATREIFWLCRDGYGVGGGRMVYLDVSQLPGPMLEKLAGILEIYEKFMGQDPRKEPMLIFPAMHYTMGGLYTVYTPKPDFKGLVPGARNNMMTNVPGLYAFGEVNYQYHGATRLGANALLSCLFDGLFCGQSVANYAKERAKGHAASAGLLEKYVQQEQQRVRRLVESDGPHNPFTMHRELAEVMTEECTVVRSEQGMQRAQGVVRRLKEQYLTIKLSDTGSWTNQTLAFARTLGDMLIYAEAILAAALARKESRGAHYRSDFPKRDDANFLKTTIAKYDEAVDRHTLALEDVPTPLIQPRARTYG